MHAGQIQRDAGEVILFCDLCGSSTLAEDYDLTGFLGFHTGTVMYGTIGTRERIEFTVCR